MKKLVSLVTALCIGASLAAAAAPVMAEETLTTYHDKRTFDEEKSWNGAGTGMSTEIKSDEIAGMLGEGNKALSIWDTSSAGNARFSLSCINFGKSYSALIADGSYDTNKMMVMEYDFYASKEFADSITGSHSVVVSLGSGSFWNDSNLGNLSFKKADNELKLGDGIVETGKWHHVAYVYDHKNAFCSVYLDGTRVRSSETLTINQSDTSQAMIGIRFIERGVSVPEGSFYFDNSEAYQVDTPFDVTAAQTNAQSGEVTLTFSNAVDMDLSNAVTVLDSKNDVITDAVVTKSADMKSATVSFDASAYDGGSEYTVKVGNAIHDKYYQNMTDCYNTNKTAAVDKEFKFTLSGAPCTYMFNNTYQDKDADTVMGGSADVDGIRAEAYVRYDDVSKKLGENNKALSVWSKANNTNSVYSLGGATFGTSTKPDYSRQIVYTYDMYVKESLKTAMGANSIVMNPSGAGSNAWNNNRIAGPATLSVTDNVLKLSNKEISTDAWHHVDYVFDVANRYFKMYVDNDLVYSSTIDGTMPTASDMFLGVRVIANNFAIPQDTLYFDNALVYQAPQNLTAAFTQTGNTINIAFSNAVKADQAQYITVTNAENQAVPCNVAVSGDGLSAKVTFDKGDLTANENYKVIITPALSDKYMQFLSTSNTVYNFTAEEDKTIYLRSSDVTAPSQSGFAATVQLGNATGTSTSAWVVTAVYDRYNMLLGASAKTIIVPENGIQDIFTITDDCSNAVSARIYIWDSEENMIPLQRSSAIWTPSAE